MQTINREDDANLDLYLKIIKIQSFFFILTVLILMFLSQFFSMNRGESESSKLPQILAVVAIFQAVIGYSLKARISKPQVTQDPEDKLAAGIKAFCIGHLVLFLFLESIAILGMIDFLCTNNSLTPLLFGGFSVVLMIFSWPKKRNLIQQLNA